MRFDLVDLSVFVSAVDNRSLTHGAKSVGIALAAASARIKVMERKLNVKLLERSRRGVHPTAAGEAMLLHARQVLASAASLEADLVEFANGLKGRIRLLSNTNALAEFLPLALGQFLAVHPDISVCVEERLSDDIARSIASGDGEIGIIASSTQVAGLKTFYFASDRLVLVVPRHSEIRSTRVAFADFLDRPFVGLRDSSAIQSYLQRIATQYKQQIRLRMQLLSFEAVCRMVEINAGIAVVPASVAERCVKTMAIRIVPLSDHWAMRELQLCISSQFPLSAISQVLLDHLIQHAHSREGQTPRLTTPTS